LSVFVHSFLNGLKNSVKVVQPSRTEADSYSLYCKLKMFIADEHKTFFVLKVLNAHS